MEATYWRVVYNGQEQVGEVVTASAWRPELAQLPQGLPFRIVLFTRPHKGGLPFIDEPRLCLCFPPQPLKALREKRSPYQVVGEWAEEYGSGQVLTASGPLPLPRLAFSLPEPDKRLNLLAKVTLFFREVTEKVASARRLAELTPLLQEVVEVMAYLEGVEVSDGELALDRATILEQLTLANIVENTQRWEGIKALFLWFRSRYSTAYKAFHRRYHGEMASLKEGIEGAMPQIRALNWLNSIAELGQPVGLGLEGEFKELMARVMPCPYEEAGVEQFPRCPGCGLGLNSQPPRGEVSALLKKLQEALRQQQRRLSSQASRLILAQGQEERVDRFIKLIQSSDPSPLVQTLDEELVSFLRQLLREAKVYTFSPPLFQELAAKFPYLEEAEVRAVVKEFERLLRATFARAKEERPGWPLRLALIGEDEARRRPGKPGTDLHS